MRRGPGSRPDDRRPLPSIDGASKLSMRPPGPCLQVAQRHRVATVLTKRKSGPSVQVALPKVIGSLLSEFAVHLSPAAMSGGSALCWNVIGSALRTPPRRGLRPTGEERSSAWRRHPPGRRPSTVDQGVGHRNCPVSVPDPLVTRVRAGQRTTLAVPARLLAGAATHVLSLPEPAH